MRKFHLGGIKKIHNVVYVLFINMGRPRIHSLNENYFKDIDTKEKAYILGFIYADGSVSDTVLTITLSNKDIEILEFIKKELQTNIPLYKRGKYLTLSVTSKNIIKDLKSLGIIKNKTYICSTLPYKSDEKFFESFISGFFDGDGSIYCNKNGKDYSLVFSNNRNILNELKKILIENYNISSCTVRLRYKDSEHSGMLEIKGRLNIEKFRKLIYIDSFCLKRKVERFDNFEKSNINIIKKYKESCIIEEVINLFKEGTKQIEISKILNIPYSSVRSIKQRYIK